jgi:hypothetical protein
MDNLFIGGGNNSPRRRRGYGFTSFLGDIIMVTITGGLWLIWIFVREMRNH